MINKRFSGFLIVLVCGLCCSPNLSQAQQSYFIDGFHGGIWGHFPYHYASFIAKQLKENPGWNINLEIEPVTWDSIRQIDAHGYAFIKSALKDTSSNARIEYVNPAYGQSYLFNISGESIIRQFQYGIQTLRRHFPGIQFNTYSSEEPCFTSALPGILRSLGFKYASLKNPNTCWGGYVAGHEGGVVNWMGPDGRTILTVPRYTGEQLEKNSTWQTTAWRNDPEYIKEALDAGIPYPIGMCLQDAGWRNGPWIGTDASSIYTTWRNYFEHVIEAPRGIQDWKLSQEDIKVSLVWGSQILQSVAQAVRKTENTLTNVESALTLKHLFQSSPWPQDQLDIAWKNLLLAQHHDCWIVPNNKKHGKNWQEYVSSWASQSLQIADSLLQSGFWPSDLNNTEDSGQKYLRVYNSTGSQIEELVHIQLPAAYAGKSVRLLDESAHEIAIQQDGDQIYFYAKVPPLGYTTYRIEIGLTGSKRDNISEMAKKMPDGQLLVVSDLYRILFDPAQGGIITSLQLKQDHDWEFVDQAKGGLNELRGFFYTEDRYRSSKETPAKLTILENGKLFTRIKVEGLIAGSPFKQIVQIDKKGRLIRTDLKIDWKGHPGIGQFDETGRFKNENLKKAFYNSRYKLLTLFPVRIEDGIIHKDAPFDNLQSQLKNTFYDRWDSIKNDVLLHWVDLSSKGGRAGLTIFSDETTTYAHGPEMPLGLTTQYSGKGLFGADYTINGPTEMRYALLPHVGNWKAGKVSQASDNFNKPLLSVVIPAEAVEKKDWEKSFLKLDPASGWEITAFKVDPEDGSLILRVWNATGDDSLHPLVLNSPVTNASLMELNGQAGKVLQLNQAGKAFQLTIPMEGIRTIRLKGWREIVRRP